MTPSPRPSALDPDERLTAGEGVAMTAPTAEERWTKLVAGHPSHMTSFGIEVGAMTKDDFLSEIRAAEQAAREREAEEIITLLNKHTFGGRSGYEDMIRARHAKKAEPRPALYQNLGTVQSADVAQSEARIREIAREEILPIAQQMTKIAELIAQLSDGRLKQAELLLKMSELLKP